MISSLLDPAQQQEGSDRIETIVAVFLSRRGSAKQLEVGFLTPSE
jgi:hypothetical protein